MSDARPIGILSAGAPKTGVRLCAEAWSAESGTPCEIEFATAPTIRERVGAGDPAADIVVVPVAAMESFVTAGKIVDGSVVPIGEIAAGVVIRNGAEEPDLSSTATLRDTLLAADCIVYNQASSGQYIETMIAKLGIADRVAKKTVRVPSGAAVMEHLAADDRPRTIGFGQVTEIRLHENIGIHLVGPLPAEIGKVTEYAAGVATNTGNVHAAASLVSFIGSDRGRAIFAETGVA